MLTGTVSVMAMNSPVNEGNQASFQIQGFGLPAGGVTVYYQTTPGSATEGADYTGLSGSVFLPQMMPPVSVNVNTLTDAVNDPNETFSLTITSVSGGASIGTGSAAMTINQPGSPPPGPMPQYVTLNSPGTINEGQNFTLSGLVSPAGFYSLSGSINWGGFVTGAGSSVNFSTNSDGSFSIPNVYFDDGTSPGNGTASDVASIWLNATINGLPFTATTTATVQNVAPTGQFELYPEGALSFLLTGTFSDPGLSDVHTVTINWGDGTPLETFTAPVGNVTRSHQYALTGQNSYPVEVSIADDDLGSWAATDAAICALVSTDILVERERIDSSFEEVPSYVELWSEERHRWTGTFSSSDAEPESSVTWYRLAWSHWLANPNFIANPLTQWTPFAFTSYSTPALAYLPVGDWVVTAMVQTPSGFYVFADPRATPANRIVQTRWEAGAPEQQFEYHTEIPFPATQLRVFPEQKTPTSPEYNQVKGVVDLEKLVALGFTFTAKMRALDPDHSHNPVNANDDFDPDDVFGTTIDIRRPDNRQTAGGFGQSVGMSPTRTDISIPFAMNKSTTLLTIEDAQPGNNFIIAVGRDDLMVNEFGISDDDGVTPQIRIDGTFHALNPSWYSEILTVWRTLWIETDSMRGPNLMTEGPFDQPLAHPEYDKSLVDVPAPQIDLLVPEYARANILVKLVEAANDPTDGNSDPATSDPGWFMHYLDVNLDTGEMPIATGAAATMADWAAQNANEFWVGQLIGAYEFHINRDHDPDDSVAVLGWTPSNANHAFVFFETSRDYVAYTNGDPNPPNVCDEVTFYKRVSLHESGHFFALPDRFLAGEPGGIMNYNYAWSPNPELAHHNWTDLGTIQSHAKPNSL